MNYKKYTNPKCEGKGPLWAKDNTSKGASVPPDFDLTTYIQQKEVELNLLETY